MHISDEEKKGIGVALNESTLLGIEVSKTDNIVSATFSVVWVDDQGKVPDDTRVQIIFFDVGKIIAKLKNGNGSDNATEIVLFEPENLLEVVRTFTCSVYGWDFIDCPDDNYNSWNDSVSMEHSLLGGKMTHTIDLFQDGVDKHLDIRMYFDSFKIFTPLGSEIALSQFIQNGKRGWDEVFAGNKTVQNRFCIYPCGDYEFKRDAQ